MRRTFFAAVLVVLLAHQCGRAVMPVRGRFLYDHCGERIVIRGAENFFDVGLYAGGAIIPQIERTGANCIRVLGKLQSGYGLTLTQFEDILQMTIDNNMIPLIWANDGTGPQCHHRQAGPEHRQPRCPMMEPVI